MRFFILDKDTRIEEVPKIINYYLPVNLEDIKDVNVIFADMKSSKEFKNIIINPLLLFPEEAKELLMAFEPWLSFKDFVLINKNKTFNHLYLFPELNEYNKWPSKEQMLDKAIFTVKEGDKRIIIIREDLASALIQDYYLGYILKEIREEEFCGRE